RRPSALEPGEPDVETATACGHLRRGRHRRRADPDQHPAPLRPGKLGPFRSMPSSPMWAVGAYVGSNGVARPLTEHSPGRTNATADDPLRTVGLLAGSRSPTSVLSVERRWLPTSPSS